MRLGEPLDWQTFRSGSRKAAVNGLAPLNWEGSICPALHAPFDPRPDPCESPPPGAAGSLASGNRSIAAVTFAAAAGGALAGGPRGGGRWRRQFAAGIY
jgi:hypothetical protein